MAPLTREERVARRDARRRQIRRRRQTALIGFAAAIAVIAGVVLVSRGVGGGADKPGSGAHADWRPHEGPVPILAFHELGDPPPGTTYPELFVSESDFRSEMNWLDRKGYEAVTLDQVEAAWFDDGRLPPKPIVLSFDDGYMPQYTVAFPVLAGHHWPGVLNLKAEGPDLFKKNVREMIAGGWELASHTINHLDMTSLDRSTMKHELAGSREILRREFKVPVNNFCYPSGRFNRKVETAVKAAGYRSATTEIPLLANRRTPYALGRFEVLGSSGTGGIASFLGA